MRRGEAGGHFKGAVSAQKNFQGSETRELLGGMEKKVFPDEGLLICLPGESMIFYYLAP